MIYYIFYELLFNQLKNGESYLVKALNVFQYVTFRTAYASITALLISLVFGSKVIQALRNWNVGQQIREEGPQAHMAKRGTPTMGGVLIIASVIISSLLWARLSSVYVWVVMVATVCFGAIGTIGVLTKQEFVLLMVGGVFVVEALSVMVQVASFKMTGRRIFKMSPLHHHFELQGWRESKVVFRFLILAILFALLSL